jgi:mono/diheme cytochrome c family protein
MAGYGTQIDTEDRWAIAAYVKTLQLSQNASMQDVPPELRGNLKKAEAPATAPTTAPAAPKADATKGGVK